MAACEGQNLLAKLPYCYATLMHACGCRRLAHAHLGVPEVEGDEPVRDNSEFQELKFSDDHLVDGRPFSELLNTVSTTLRVLASAMQSVHGSKEASQRWDSLVMC